MNAVAKLRRLAQHRERMAKLDLAFAERERAAQEQVVTDISVALASTLSEADENLLDHLHRHGFASRLEFVRRTEEQQLEERTTEVGVKREIVQHASREKGSLDRLIEIEETAVFTRLTRTEQARLDETGLIAWWRRSP
jgi:flagellar export protein FliJ